MKFAAILILLALLGFISWRVLSPSSAVAQDLDNQTTAQKQDSSQSATEQDSSDVPKALRFKMKSIDGEEVDLAKYAGKVIVIVNVASRCGMTPQYEDLQKLHEDYGDKGVVVLGFPCNQFGSQEPGSEADIKTFCSTKYGVTFDMFSKIDVKGDQASDLYKHLTEQDVKPQGSGPVKWNFEKFVLDQSGNVIARFGSRVKPSSKDFIEVIEKAVAEESGDR